MGLDIENAHAHRLAHELAELTGESITAAMTPALRERLNRLRLGSDVPLSQRLLRIGQECAASLKEPYRSADHADLLYGEEGLPKTISTDGEALRILVRR